MRFGESATLSVSLSAFSGPPPPPGALYLTLSYLSLSIPAGALTPREGSSKMSSNLSSRCGVDTSQTGRFGLLVSYYAGNRHIKIFGSREQRKREQRDRGREREEKQMAETKEACHPSFIFPSRTPQVCCARKHSTNHVARWSLQGRQDRGRDWLAS